jgi:hypothetical protein
MVTHIPIEYFPACIYKLLADAVHPSPHHCYFEMAPHHFLQWFIHFTQDAGLIGDGCFFAAILLVEGDLDQDADNELKGKDGLPWDVDIKDGIDACLSALREMGWIFANSHDQEKSACMVWEAQVICNDEHH